MLMTTSDLIPGRVIKETIGLVKGNTIRAKHIGKDIVAGLRNIVGGEITEYAIFPTWNHWPVAQMPSDGRYASYPDRTCHSSLSHLYPPNYKEQFGNRPFAEKLFMEGMLNKDPILGHPP